MCVHADQLPEQCECERIEQLMTTEYVSICRTIRSLGIPETEVDDCVQEVFLVATRKLAQHRIREQRAFLLSVALRVASTRRRTIARRREDGDEALACQPAHVPSAEELVDRKRQREALDHILREMDLEYRTVFVLFELEGQHAIEIAQRLGIPSGTVASRLRRARRFVRDAIQREQARRAFRRNPR